MQNSDLLAFWSAAAVAVSVVLSIVLIIILCCKYAKFRRYRKHILYKDDMATMHFDTFLRLYRLDRERWYFDFAGCEDDYVEFRWKDYGRRDEESYCYDWRYVGFPYFTDFYKARRFIRCSERRKEQERERAQIEKCACNSIEFVEAMRKNLAFRAEREQDELNKMALKIKEITLSRETGK